MRTTTNPIRVPFRDLRIDLIRGIALLILFSDHVRGNVIGRFTPVAVGLSDMSDVFVFLSGYSCGISYGRRLAKDGFVDCVKRAWTRAGQIYVVKVLITALSLSIVLLADKWVTPYFFGLPWNMELVRQCPIETLLEIEMFRLELFQYFVLALYIPILLILPVVILGLTKSPLVTFGTSALIYSAVQCFPEYIKLPEPWCDAMGFNIFAWQFLFISACGLALMNPRTRSVMRPNRLVASLALVGLLVAFAGRSRFGIPSDENLISKVNLGVLRLIHFAAVVVVGWRFVPSTIALSKTAALHPFMNCGRYPLVGYCCGGLLAILSEIVFRICSFNWPLQLVVNLVGWCGCVVATTSWGILWNRISVRDLS